MGKASAIGEPTRPTWPFILSGSINLAVSYFIECVPVAPSGECSRGLAGAVGSTAVCRVWQQLLYTEGLTLLYIVLPCLVDVVLC